MNKLSTKNFALTFISVLMIALFGIFASACGKEKEQTKNIELVQANNIEEYYHNTATIDFSAVTLTVTYDDNTNATLSNGQVDIDIENAQSDTQFVLYTDGLSAMEGGSLTVGTYRITCQIVGGDTIYNLCTVTISDNMNLIYNLTYFGEPEFVTTYKTNVAATEQEDSFYNSSEVYTVGDDNEFVFKPEMSLMSKEDSTIYEPSEFDVNVNVYLVINNDSTLLTDETYFTYADFAFNFTDLAVGQTFRIEMTPSDFSTDSVGNTINPITFTFKVEDGWNAYTADDIARMCIVDYDITDYSGATSKAVFYDVDTKKYVTKKTYTLWEEYLTDKGYSSESLTSINGIFMHGNISITPDDMPEEFYVTDAEENTYAAGSLRDFVLPYIHYLNADFVFNGNYFMVDASGIPLCLSNTDNSQYLYTEDQSQYYAGHSTLFSFSGKSGSTEDLTATFKNVNSIGNTGGVVYAEGEDDTEALKASGGLILLKSKRTNTYVYNCIAKEYLIAWYGEDSLSSYRAETGSIDIDSVKTYDCFNCGAFSYESDYNTISNSEFKRFGGPVILMISASESGTVTSYAGFAVDDNSTLESYVTGSEAWFVMQGGVGIATNLIALDPLLNTYNVSMLTEVEVTSSGGTSTKNCINLIGLMMDDGYMGSTEEQIFVDYSRSDDGTNYEFSTYDNTTINTLLTSTSKTPIFMSSAGDIAYMASATSIAFATENEQFSGSELFILYPVASTMIGIVLGLTQTA